MPWGCEILRLACETHENTILVVLAYFMICSAWMKQCTRIKLRENFNSAVTCELSLSLNWMDMQQKTCLLESNRGAFICTFAESRWLTLWEVNMYIRVSTCMTVLSVQCSTHLTTKMLQQVSFFLEYVPHRPTLSTSLVNSANSVERQWMACYRKYDAPTANRNERFVTDPCKVLSRSWHVFSVCGLWFSTFPLEPSWVNYNRHKQWPHQLKLYKDSTPYDMIPKSCNSSPTGLTLCQWFSGNVKGWLPSKVGTPFPRLQDLCHPHSAQQKKHDFKRLQGSIVMRTYPTSKGSNCSNALLNKNSHKFIITH
jgi:hypothetical protein